MSEHREPEVMDTGTGDGPFTRLRLWYGQTAGPWLLQTIGNRRLVALAVLVALAFGGIGGALAMDARADAAADRRTAHTVTLAAFARLASDSGEDRYLEVSLVNIGARPVTVTSVTVTGLPANPAEARELGGVLLPGAYISTGFRGLEPYCDMTGSEAWTLQLEVDAGDARPQRLEIPVVGATSMLRELGVLYCLDLPS